MTRDRGGAYALAAARALPGAVQVADRWHLMENASQAFLAATRAYMRQVRAAVGAATVDPRLLTAAEKLQCEGYLRREDVNAANLALHKVGKPIKEIVRCTGHSRGTVRRVLRGQRAEMFRTRENSLEAHLPWLDARWAEGARNGAALSLPHHHVQCSRDRAAYGPYMLVRPARHGSRHAGAPSG